MQVILLVDDKKLGKKNTVIEVADSYARNVLIPKKIATMATSTSLHNLQQQLASENYRYEQARQKALLDVIRLNELGKITLKAEGGNGKMFGAVTTKDISQALLNVGFDIKKQSILLKTPIKDFGSHEFIVKLFDNITAKVIVEVLPK